MRGRGKGFSLVWVSSVLYANISEDRRKKILFKNLPHRTRALVLIECESTHAQLTVAKEHFILLRLTRTVL